jgi:hypothetical protein
VTVAVLVGTIVSGPAPANAAENVIDTRLGSLRAGLPTL